MGGADTRGFHFPLEPALNQREWKFDAVLARLAKLNKRMAERQAACEAVRDECAGQAAGASRTWAARPDPATQTRQLNYLAALHRRKLDIESEIVSLTAALQHARQECAEQHQGLDVLGQHRADLRMEFGREQLRKFAVHADQDWIARASHGFNREDVR